MSNWYAVKSLYRMDVSATPEAEARLSSFEERVVLMRASSFEQALEKAQREARAYAEDGAWTNARGETVTTRHLEALDAFLLTEDELADGCEVYSKMLFVAPSLTDEELVERGLGKVAEQTSTDAAGFEPDLGELET
jgi:hypothetical protein